MKKPSIRLTVWFSSCVSTSACQHMTTDEKLSVADRMGKARAINAQKQADKTRGKSEMKVNKIEKAPAADDKAPVDTVLTGPKGDIVRTGERGANFYLNKNGNKTYLSRNQ